MIKRYTIVNDQFLPAELAVLHTDDMALQRGYGIFDFFKTLGDRPIYLNDHLGRFFSSAQKMNLPLELSKEKLKELLEELLEKNKIPDSGVRLTLTGGYAEDGYSIAKPNLIINQKPLVFNAENQSPPMHLVTYKHQRQLPEVKSTDYLMAVWLRNFVKEKGANEVLYEHNGAVTECPRANFFIVTQNNILVTPEKEILKGVIRKHTLELAAANMQIEERPITLAELGMAKEAFVSSTTKHLWPVTKVNEIIIGNGRPGQVTASLNKQLWHDICKD